MRSNTLSALAVGVLALAAAPAGRAAEVEVAKVVVAGTAKIRVPPDQAYVMLAIESRDANPRTAQQQNARISDAVLAKLRSAGLGAKAIRTLSYDLQEEFDYDKGKRRSRGYLARNQVEVRIDDIDRVGEVIDLATGAGATSVAGLRFDVKERSRIEREALERAVADGKARAIAAAAGAGARIGGLLLIEEEGSSRPPGPSPLLRGAVAMAAEAAPTPPIAAGEIEISARVRVTAALGGAAPPTAP